MTKLSVVMMGTGTFAEPSLEALLARPSLVVGVVTQPDRAAGNVRGSTRQVGKGMKAIAEAAGVPVFQPESINTPEGVELLRGLRPDLLVVAAYGQILSKDVLGVPPLGGINVHGSLLPKYRGAAPVAWAILRGETRTGVTIIRMTTGLDAGDMLAQEAIAIGPEETAGEVEARLAPLGARLALEVIDRMRQGPVVGEKQDPAQVTKAPKLKKEDGLIEWSQPAEPVVRQIRAMQPWPTAYTFRHCGEQPPARLLITEAKTFDRSISQPPKPGKLFTIPGRGMLLVEVGGREAVLILKLQPTGKREMHAAEYLNGRPVRPDADYLGPEVLS
jgi:methionyl-tRNA formyltransferase